MVENVDIPVGTVFIQASSLDSETLELSYTGDTLSTLRADIDINSENSPVGELLLGTPTAGFYINSTNTEVAFGAATAYSKVPVKANERIRYNTKYGSAAVGVIFLDANEAVVGFTSSTPQVTQDDIVTAPATATHVRVSTLGITPTIMYTDIFTSNKILAGKSYEALGDSITQGSSIQSQEGISTDEAKRLVYCGLVGSNNGMVITNSGKGGTRIASWNPYGRTVAYMNSGTVLAYDETHYLGLNTAQDGRTFTTPASCNSIRLTLAFTDSVTTANTICTW